MTIDRGTGLSIPFFTGMKSCDLLIFMLRTNLKLFALDIWVTAAFDLAFTNCKIRIILLNTF